RTGSDRGGEKLECDRGDEHGPGEPPRAPAVQLVFQSRPVRKRRPFNPFARRIDLQQDLKGQPPTRDGDRGHRWKREAVQHLRRRQRELTWIERKTKPKVIDKYRQREKEDDGYRDFASSGVAAGRRRWPATSGELIRSKPGHAVPRIPTSQ